MPQTWCSCSLRAAKAKPTRLAVDALNLRADERGMGRYVRPILREFAARTDIDLTLVVRQPRATAEYATIVGRNVRLASVRTAGAVNAFDCAWFPWNGMRFQVRAPALVTINDDFAFAYPARDFIGRRREQRPIQTAVRQAAQLVTISEWSRRTLCERFALTPERIGVLPLAPDAYFCAGEETSPFAEPFVLAVGTGEVRKNIAFLIRVFEQAFPERNVRLVLVGDRAPLGAQLHAANVPITILAHVDDAELRRLYRTAGAVAVPSLAEGFGLVAAEAQACGAAVIVAKTSALPEAVGAAGVVVELAFDAWRDALQRLVRDPGWNATFRALGIRRWAGARQATLPALVAALERTLDNRV